MKTFLFKFCILIICIMMLFAEVCYAGDVINFGSDLTTFKTQELVDKGNMFYDEGVGKYILPFSIAGGDGFYELTINGRKVDKSQIHLLNDSDFVEYEGTSVEDDEGRAYFEFDQFNAFSGTGNYFLFIDPEDVSEDSSITEQWITTDINEIVEPEDIEGNDGDEEDDDDDADLLEIVISAFILLLGKGLRALISLVAGSEISIDSLLFDRYGYTSLSFFKNDVKVSGNSGRNISRKSIINFWCY